RPALLCTRGCRHHAMVKVVGEGTTTLPEPLGDHLRFIAQEPVGLLPARYRKLGHHHSSARGKSSPLLGFAQAIRCRREDTGDHARCDEQGFLLAAVERLHGRKVARPDPDGRLRDGPPRLAFVSSHRTSSCADRTREYRTTKLGQATPWRRCPDRQRRGGAAGLLSAAGLRCAASFGPRWARGCRPDPAAGSFAPAPAA